MFAGRVEDIVMDQGGCSGYRGIDQVCRGLTRQQGEDCQKGDGATGSRGGEEGDLVVEVVNDAWNAIEGQQQGQGCVKELLLACVKERRRKCAWLCG